MVLISESVDTKQRVLIAGASTSNVAQLLKREFKKYDMEVYASSLVPPNLTGFDYLFFINDEAGIFKKIQKRVGQKLVLVFTGTQRSAHTASHYVRSHNLSGVKVIHLPAGDLTEDELEKLLWFSFSKSKEISLQLSPHRTRKQRARAIHSFSLPHYTIHKTHIILFILAIFFIYHLAMVPFLGLSLLFFNKSVSAFRKSDIKEVKKNLDTADFLTGIGSYLYGTARPSYLLFSLALLPDSIVAFEQQMSETLRRGVAMSENSDRVLELLLKKGKSADERQQFEIRLAMLQKDVELLETSLTLLQQGVEKLSLPFPPTLKTNFSQLIDAVEKAKKILPHADTLLAKGTQKKYLLLFANNMELRPGGGFIGSFGILNIEDMTISDIKVYDVYDADGQLKIHVAPPDAIRRYLKQPHWFLRDSAFSSDFYDNYAQAKFFLEEELQMRDFAGGIIITTSAIQNMLSAYPNIFLSDFNEIVNKDNFYLKAQYHSEKNFFPGSTQKKTFLGSLANQLFINMESASPPQLFQMVKKSLDEKQIAVILEDGEVQKVLDSLYWAGKTIFPRCAVPDSTNCVVDYIFPLDANLGVNKANFFVSRSLTQRVVADQDGRLTNTLNITIKNDSPQNVFPGGTYKNYFQILIPKGAQISQITKNAVLVEDYEETEEEFKTVGFFIEILPRQSSEITVRYSIPDRIQDGKGIYQLVFQKQIGAKNSDLTLEIVFPKNISIINQNFSPLVKDNRIFYNTNLATDKIFVVEILKQ